MQLQKFTFTYFWQNCHESNDFTTEEEVTKQLIWWNILLMLNEGGTGVEKQEIMYIQRLTSSPANITIEKFI